MRAVMGSQLRKAFKQRDLAARIAALVHALIHLYRHAVRLARRLRRGLTRRRPILLAPMPAAAILGPPAFSRHAGALLSTASGAACADSS